RRSPSRGGLTPTRWRRWGGSWARGILKTALHLIDPQCPQSLFLRCPKHTLLPLCISSLWPTGHFNGVQAALLLICAHVSCCQSSQAHQRLARLCPVHASAVTGRTEPSLPA